MAQNLSTPTPWSLAVFTASNASAAPASSHAAPLPPPVVVAAPDAPARTLAQVMADAAYTLVAKAQGGQDDVLKLLRG